MITIFEATRPATLSDVSWLRKALTHKLVDLHIRQEIIEDFAIVVSEIGANVIEHSPDTPAAIKLTVSLAGAGLAISLEDDGAPWPAFPTILKSELEAVPPESESGRGLWLVRQALDRVTYRSIGVNRFEGWRSFVLSRPSVLIVEDTPALLDLYSSYLTSGYKVLASPTLDEARRLLRDRDIDIVLADLHLGDGLGVSLTQEIETGSRKTFPPVILISSDTSAEMREMCLRYGAEFFVRKPVHARELRETISLALARSGLRNARLTHAFARHVDGLLHDSIPGEIGRYRTAHAGASATAGGGDMIMHFALPEAHRIILVDVMGHGVQARAWAIAYASMIRTMQHCRPALDAGQFLTELARLAWEEPALQHALATILVADLDVDGASIVSAGHPGPVVVASNGISFPAVAGPLLGVLPPEPFRITRLDLRKGDRLYLVTDGLDPVDVASGGAPPSWFTDVISAFRHRNFEDASEALVDQTRRAVGPQPLDDWTIVQIERS